MFDYICVDLIKVFTNLFRVIGLEYLASNRCFSSFSFVLRHFYATCVGQRYRIVAHGLCIHLLMLTAR